MSFYLMMRASSWLKMTVNQQMQAVIEPLSNVVDQSASWLRAGDMIHREIGNMRGYKEKG